MPGLLASWDWGWYRLFCGLVQMLFGLELTVAATTMIGKAMMMFRYVCCCFRVLHACLHVCCCVLILLEVAAIVGRQSHSSFDHEFLHQVHGMAPFVTTPHLHEG